MNTPELPCHVDIYFGNVNYTVLRIMWISCSFKACHNSVLIKYALFSVVNCENVLDNMITE